MIECNTCGKKIKGDEIHFNELTTIHFGYQCKECNDSIASGNKSNT